MESTDAPSPAMLRDESFARYNQVWFDEYVMLRLHGEMSTRAFLKVFPPEWDVGGKAFVYAQAVEFNPYVVSTLRDAIAAADPKTLWNPKLAIHALVEISRDLSEKGTVRLGAMKELNVLCEITVIDENGKTRAGRSLSDFYRDEANNAPAANEANESGSA
ncbi:hypothetical protein PLUTO_00520 [Luteibacter phage vB_LflM-Pluto]|uniref:Terminase small subunit n=1 Tax=Luteibacter phage vB_LflM-Pluto TaxID=2948611 RepID=A0A9E7MTE8_9CAUD|nr:hypothetical protein PLUTO_00520 [Luteibacter phage vB_LflM-Pluto]